MGQVTIYLDDEIEKKMITAAKSAHLSKSKWIAQVINEKVVNDWPDSIIDLSGSWADFPDLEKIRLGMGKDSDREKF